MNLANMLKEHGLKVTTARKTLLSALLKADKPICYENVKCVLSMDKTTFYRNMSLFEQHGLVSGIESAENRRYYEHKNQKHAHFVCLGCGSIECLAIDYLEQIEVFLPKFSVEGVTVKGYCNRCKST